MIYLIGGITCSGKTTLAQKLNTLYNIEVYKVDDDIIKFADETDVCKDIGSPLDYIFSLDIEAQVNFYLTIYNEVFDKVIAKIKSLNSKDLIVEGTALLPDLVKKFPFEYKYIVLHPSNGLLKRTLLSRNYIKNMVLNDSKRLDVIYRRNIVLDSNICESAKKSSIQVINVDDFSNGKSFELAIKHFDLKKKETSITTLKWLAASGNSLAKEYLDYFITLNNDFFNEKKSFIAFMEARYHVTNNYIESNNIETIIDFPCGCTPRPYEDCLKEKKYIGLDLSNVIRLNRIISPFKKNDGRVCLIDSQAELDWNKYITLCGNEKIVLTTEGLLMFLNDDSIELFFKNIIELMKRYDLIWITPDFEFYRQIKLFFSVIDGTEILNRRIAKYKEKSNYERGYSFANNTYLVKKDDDEERVIKKLNEKGMQVKQIRYSEYLENLRTYPNSDMLLNASKLWECSLSKEF